VKKDSTVDWFAVTVIYAMVRSFSSLFSKVVANLALAEVET
jgi:hypothetical protein